MLNLATLRAYAELMRVANVLTAISNVWMGMIFATGRLPGWIALGISLASACLYLGGMVLNDVFDASIDAKERPERPIPSGRVAVGHATILGWSLLAAGFIAAWVTARFTPTTAPAIIATVLIAAVVAYDRGLKLSAWGPAVMGACRLLNVLMGLSVASDTVVWYALPRDVNTTPAIAMGVYIWAVSWFARSEATKSRKGVLMVACVGTLLGLLLFAGTPFVQHDVRERLLLDPIGWIVLWIVLWIVVGGSILRRMVVAVVQPTPRNVQRAVGNAILSIIAIDAAVCLGYAQPYWACAVLALFAPAMLLAQAFKVT